MVARASGRDRDGKKGKAQIVYGLLCAADGCPVAIEAFEGNTGDPSTVADQVDKLKRRFALDHVVLVGDRGMIAQARIDEDLRPAGLDWITALRAPAPQGLVGGGYLQMPLFDDRDMAAITSPDFLGERLIVCRNHDLAHERARKREDLLLATEHDLAKVAAAIARKTRPLRGAAEIGLAVDAARAKSATGRTADGAPVHSFQSLLADLATLARNPVVTALAPDRPFTILTRPTPIWQKAFDILAISIAYAR